MSPFPGLNPEWFVAVLGRAVVVLVTGLVLAAAVLPVSGFWLAVGGLWAAALMVRAQVWAAGHRFPGEE